MKYLRKFFIVICCVNFLITGIIAQGFNHEFQTKYYEIKDNPWSDIWDVTIDHEKFLWFSTYFGLYRFDGREFKRYHNNSEDPNSLPHNVIRAIFGDSQNRLWVHGYSFDLAYLDKETNDFIKVSLTEREIQDLNIYEILEPIEKQLLLVSQYGGIIELKNYGDKNFKVESNFSDIPFASGFQDENNQIWLGTFNEGVYVIQDVNDIKNSLKHEIDIKGLVYIIQQYGDKLILTSTEGLFIYNKNTEELRNVELPYQHLSPGIQSMVKVKNEKFWISNACSILEFDAEEEVITQIVTTESNNLLEAGYSALFNVGDNKIIAGFREGVYLFDFNKSVFDNIGVFEQNNDFAETGYVSAVLVDGNDLWYGKHTGNLVLRRNKTEYTINLEYVNGKNQKGYPRVQNIVKDTVFNRIWFGGNFGVGYVDAVEIDPKNLEPIIFSEYKEGKFNIPTSQISTLDVDEDGTIWAGTFGNGVFNVVSLSEDRFVVNKFPSTEDFLNDRPVNMVYSMKSDKDLIWLGTKGGLVKLKPAKDKKSFANVEHFYKTESDESLSRDDVLALDIDKSGNLWIAALGGINLYQGEGKFKSWTNIPDVNNGEFPSILCDDNGKIWLSTHNSGLLEFDPDTGVFEQYHHTEGVANSDYSKGKYKDEFGNLYFAGDYGITFVNPDDIEKIKPDHEIYLAQIDGDLNTELKNKIPNSYNRPPLINIKHNQFPVQLHFSALGYSYKTLGDLYYRITPGSDRWNKMAGTDLQLVNLKPNSYTIEVNGSNVKGLWDRPPFEVKLKVLPPFWLTTWAYILYGILIISGVYYFYRFQLSRKLALSESVHLKKLDELKSKMYANISHEFRTPLTIIKGLSGTLLKKSDSGSDKELLKGIDQSNDQLLNLVNQMLDLASLDADKMEVQYKNDDIIDFIRKSVGLYQSYSDSKLLGLEFRSEEEEFFMDFDDDKLQKILNNLLSNAIKFTPQKGFVKVHVGRIDDHLQIRISDTGKGIRKKELPLVFERYYKTYDTQGREGSGIGLSLTKELVELMEGTINVKSKKGEGTSFTISLPVRNEALSSDVVHQLPFVERAINFAINEPERAIVTSGKTILLVEDNTDILSFISSILSPAYYLLVAKNGLEGLEMARKKEIDFIISDVMMPKMDGFEFCKRIKSDTATSHIPFIILSARTHTKDKQQAYKLGVDAFLTKPFNPDELKLIIENLLVKQKNQKQQLSKILTLQQPEIDAPDINKLDLDLIADLQRIILESKVKTSANSIAKQLLLSRAQLHRKIKSLTGKSLTQYANHIRIEKAKHLLLTTELQVKEIAYSLGFESSTYFIRLFKKETNSTPENFRNTSVSY